VYALAFVIGNNDGCGSCVLSISHFLDKGTSSTIDHEDKGGLPVGSKDGVAHVFSGVDDVLLNGSAVRGDAEQSLAVVISAWPR
jgi:hypothetical protein